VAPKIFDAFVFALNRAMFRNSPSGNREDTRMASKWTYMTGNSDDEREQEVRQEIEDFLAALSSYPERVAKDPTVSFEQHLYSVLTMNFSDGPRPRYEN
jgi:hypothetical protein